MANMTNYYTVYDRRNDDVLAHGSAEECAKALGIKQPSFYCLVTRAKQRPNGKYEVLVEQAEEEEEED